MSSYRVTLVALATFITMGLTSIASACCDFGYAAPVAYAPVGCGGCGGPTAAAVYAQPIAPAPIYVATGAPSFFGGPCCGYNGCGNCGASGFAGYGGCGSCGASGFAGYGGCGNCGASGFAGYGGCGSCGAAGFGGCGGCGGSVGYAVAAPSPYVVNQGPYYSGPAITAPYATYTPEAAYAPPSAYPYVPGYGYGVQAYPGYYGHPHYRARYAYRGPVYRHPRVYRPGPRYYGASHWRHYP